MHNDSPSTKNYKVRVLIETVVEVADEDFEAFNREIEEARSLTFDNFDLKDAIWVESDRPARFKYGE